MAFLPPLLDQKLAQMRRQNERDRQQLLSAALLWLQQNAARFGIDEGYLFGSVTQPGRFTQHSDVDVAIESIAAGQPFGLLSYLSTHLDREVDVVPLDQCHFADKIARPDSCGTRTNWRLTRPKPLNVMVSKIPISIY